MTTLAVLQSATALPAKYFGLHDRGSIYEGLRADLVLPAKNPLEDIQFTRSVRKVWCSGELVHQTDA